MRLREVFDLSDPPLTLLTGTESDLDRSVQRVFTTDLLDPGRYLSGGELVLTGLMWWRHPADSECFAANLADLDITAIGAGEAALGRVPTDLIDACRRHRLALFGVPVDVSFQSITEAVSQSLLAQRTSGLATQLGRQRGLVSAMAHGAHLVDLLPPVADELAVSCWVRSATGRLIAGTAPLPATLADRLTHAFLAADRLPHTVELDGRHFLLLLVPGRPEHRLAAWCLVCTDRSPSTPDGTRSSSTPDGPVASSTQDGLDVFGDLSTPDSLNRLDNLDRLDDMDSLRRVSTPDGPDRPDRLDRLDELISLATLERAQLEQGRRAERRLAAQLTRLLASPSEPADLRAALRACRLSPDATYLVVAASVVEETTAIGAPPTAAPARAKLAVYLLEELIRPLSTLAPVGRSPAGSMAVLAVKPRQASGAIEALRTAARSLAPGLHGQRLAIGVSHLAHGAVALPGAAEQARYTHRTATRLPDRTALVSSADLASHMLLLASVGPDARQSLRDLLLGPLAEYDRAHHADLIDTLDAFLRCSGSWQRCAEEMHVHVNTLRYRLRRVEELTGRDLSHFEDRVDFFLALRLLPS